MTTTFAPVYVEAPPTTPLPFGLLSAALVVDDPDDRFLLGSQYEPGYCGPAYDSTGVCDRNTFGTLSVSVGTTRDATTTASGFPVGGTFSVDWGDGNTGQGSDPDGLTHTYAANGTYIVVVTDDRNGYTASASVAVANGSASGPDAATVGFSKIASDGISIVQGHPFYLYHLLRCRALGSWDRVETRSRDALRLGEQRAVERVLADLLARDADVVDLTPGGTAQNPVDGLALLEGWSAANYGAVPVIHVPRAVGTILCAIGGVRRGTGGTTLETAQGALVASGGGYGTLYEPTSGAGALPAPDAGESWLYVTGTVTARRSPVIEVRQQANTQGGVNGEVYALAERPYDLAWECITGAVKVTTGFEVPV